jgi:hypothetical protein
MSILTGQGIETIVIIYTKDMCPYRLLYVPQGFPRA